jgi:membrane-bound serine protease (ClpP class)
VVFFGHYIAGLSGHEPMLFCLLGVLLIAVEIFFFPGMLVPALAGAALVLGSLIWAMLDLWPGEPISFSGDILLGPLANVLTGVALAFVIFLAILRFLPRGGPWGGMVLEASVGGAPSPAMPLNEIGRETGTRRDLIGLSGKAVTDLFPSGQVEVSGKRYEAKLAVGHAEAGTEIRVCGISEFSLIVEVIS